MSEKSASHGRLHSLMKTENTKGFRTDPMLGRRGFLGTAAMGSLALTVPQVAGAVVRALKKPVKIGVIADLHQDVMHHRAIV